MMIATYTRAAWDAGGALAGFSRFLGLAEVLRPRYLGLLPQPGALLFQDFMISCNNMLKTFTYCQNILTFMSVVYCDGRLIGRCI